VIFFFGRWSVVGGPFRRKKNEIEICLDLHQPPLKTKTPLYTFLPSTAIEINRLNIYLKFILFNQNIYQPVLKNE